MPRNPGMPPLMPEPEEDFSNEEVLIEILTGDDAVRLAKLRSFLSAKGIAPEKIDLAMAVQKLRKKVREEMEIEIQERMKIAPEPTAEENSMGALAEMIEPQVRDAVMKLRRKGYDTLGSGFWGMTHQNIYGGDDFLKEVPASTLEVLASKGVTVEDDQISFDVDSADLGALKRKWNEIADALPDLGHPAPDSTIPAAESFRRKMKKK